MAQIRSEVTEKGTEFRVGRAKLDAHHIIEMARQIVRDKSRQKREGFTSPELVKKFLLDYCMGAEHEQFGVMFLDSQHRQIETEILFSGTINAAPVYPREVVKAVIKHNAAAIFLFHNHPSGNSEPSRADERVTSRLKNALEMIDVSILDHFVVGDTHVCSFAERGLL